MKYRKILKLFVFLLSFSLFFNSCKKDDSDIDDLESPAPSVSDNPNNSDNQKPNNSDSSDSPSTDNPSDDIPSATLPKDVENLKAAPGDRVVLLSWQEPDSDITLIRIDCFLSENIEDEKTEIVITEKKASNKEDRTNSCSIDDIKNDEILKNGVKYIFVVKTKDSKGNYSKGVSVECIPRKIYPVEIDRCTAIEYDGDIHISWAYKPKSDLAKETLIYENGKLKEKITPVSMFENISEDALNEISLYSEYYAYKTDVSTYPSLEFRAVNNKEGEEKIESLPLPIPEVQVVTLPVVEIQTENGKIITNEEKERGKKIKATLSIKNCETPIPSKADDEPVALTVKGRGNSSWVNAPKKSYTLKFDDKQSVLGMPKHKSYALIANYFDKTLLRNVTAYEIGREIYKNMSWTPTAKSVHLFFNGVYEGIYAFTETNKIDENRVNVKSIEKCTDINDFYKYGYLLEANQRADEIFNFETNQMTTFKNSAGKQSKLVFSLKEPDGEDISNELKEKIKEEVLKRENALFSEDFADENSSNYWKNYFDESSFIDWWIVSELACNTDSDYFSSCYVYYDPKDDLLHAGPLWDFDLGFGNMRDLVDTQKIKTANGVWLKRMFEDPSFKTNANTRWEEKKSELETYMSNKYTENLTALKKDVDLNFIRWPILGKSTWKCPSDYDTRITYDEEVNYFKNWIENRKTFPSLLKSLPQN